RRPLDRRRSQEPSRAAAVFLSIPIGNDVRRRRATERAAADKSIGVNPSMKLKRRNERSAVTKSFVALTETVADARNTAPVTSLTVRPASSPLGAHQSR